MSFLHKLRQAGRWQANKLSFFGGLNVAGRPVKAWLRGMIATRTRVLLLALGGCGVLYLGLFALPRQVTFAYSKETCKTELTLLPSLYRTVDASKFNTEHQGLVQVGSKKLAATKTCFRANTAPREGIIAVESAPFGGLLFRARYTMSVREAPRIVSPAGSVTLAMSKPLKFQISQADKIFEYQLRDDDKSQKCKVQQANLECKFDELGLAQGTTHNLKLLRLFAGNKVEEVATTAVTILPPVQVSSSSIKNDEQVFSKPKNLVITADKTLVSATAKLESLDGESATRIDVQVKVIDASVEISWPNDLPREKSFRLTLLKAEATDGSTLAAPYVTVFKTSGGPKVVGINIGSANVSGDATVVVTFDQPLAADLDVTKFASIAGGSAAISRNRTQIHFGLQGVPRCAAFTLSIAKGLVGENGVVSTQPWFFASRVTCRLTKTIGYSVNGRPIQAYFYGSGSTTILFTGGIHGTEPSGTYTMQSWASHLDSYGYKIPADKQVVIVPNLNPDGIATNQRYNVHGVNLDRNFPTSDWVSDIPIQNGQIVPGGGGTSPLSEPETKAIAALTASLRPRVMISFHAQGSLVGINEVGDSAAIGSLYASNVGYQKMFYNAEDVMGHDFTGEYEMWIGENLGLPAVLIELPTRQGDYFRQHQSILWKIVNL